MIFFRWLFFIVWLILGFNTYAVPLYVSDKPITYDYCEELKSNKIPNSVVGNDLAICLFEKIVAADNLDPILMLKGAMQKNHESALYNLCLFYIDNDNYEPVIRYISEFPKNKYMMELKSTFLISGRLMWDKKSDPIELLINAAKLENAAAQYKLGVAYKNGFSLKRSIKSIPKDTEKAIHWLKLARDNLVGAANYELGYIFEKDRYNYRKAFQYYYESASAGDVKGMFAVALAYERGLGVAKDVPRAVHLYEFVAKEGYVNAWTNLGSIFLNGKDGVVIDLPRARKYLEKGANAGNVKAQYNLGLSYLKGNPTESDVEAGIKYLKLASDGGDKESKELIDMWVKTQEN